MLFIAQFNNDSFLVITPPWFWCIFGIILCLLELFLPKNIGSKYRFIAVIMGGSALIVSLILWRSAIYLGFQWQYIMYEGFDLQVMYWMGLSITGAIWIRPMFIKRKKVVIPEALDAITITEIIPGKKGRVIYEGCSWQACCEDKNIAISANQKVCVVRREGNTLIIAPEDRFLA